MKILFDLTYISPGSTAGIYNYAYRLLAGIARLGRHDDILLLACSDNRQILQTHGLSSFRSVVMNMRGTELTRKVPHLRGLLNKNLLERIIVDNRIDVFFSPYLSADSLYCTGVPTVGVMHDAQAYILKKSQLLKGPLFRLCMKRIVNNLAQLVTISEHAKRSIIEIVDPKPPIDVIYNSVTIYQNDDCSDTNTKSGERYILYVNTLMAYKNLSTLIKAFGLLADKIPHKLYVKGNATEYWRNTLLPLITESGLEQRVVLIETPYDEQQMAPLYRNADLFVSPSLMEGFGFTPIEAAMHEIPVIASTESAIPEVTMGLVGYYEPACDEHALADKIFATLNAPPSHSELRSIAETYRTVYSPERQADALLNLISKILY